MDQKKVELKRRHPALILLAVALDGTPVKIGDEEWAYSDDVFGVVRKAFDEEGNETGTYVFGADISVQAWIKMCEKAPEADIIAAIFAHVANRT